jgi:hypothetical protein
MNLDSLPLCGRARELTRALRAGRAGESGLLRHVEACPRCRAGLAARSRQREDATQAARLTESPGPTGQRLAFQRVEHVLTVVRAAGRVRLAALLGQLARACAVRHGLADAGGALSEQEARETARLLREIERLRRRLALAVAELPEAWPTEPPAPEHALAAAHTCLRAAERLDGASELRRLQLAACALLAGDERQAGALCGELVAQVGHGAEREHLVRRAGRVARAWGLAPSRLLPLLRQPVGASAN